MADLSVRYESLLRISGAIRAQHDTAGFFDLLADELRKVVDFDGIAQFDEQSNKVNWRFCAHGDEAASGYLRDLPKDQTVAWWVHEHQQPLVIPDLETEVTLRIAVDRMRRLGLRSLCAVPLATSHRRMGSLVTVSKRVDAYSEDEVRFLSQAADQIALAMADALSYREAQRNGERLRMLLDLTNRLVSTLDLRELLREIAANIREVMHCDGAGVTLPDPENGELRLYALDFPGSKGILREGIPIGSSTSVAKTFRTGQPMNLTAEEIRSERRRSARRRVHRGRRAVSLAGGEANRDRGGERHRLRADRDAEGSTGAGEDLSRRRDSHGAELRRDRRHQRRAAACAATGGDGGTHGFDGSHLWRDRHRQGIDRARSTQFELAHIERVREAELRGDSDGAARKRAVRA
jgi:GAF domain-containing protein